MSWPCIKATTTTFPFSPSYNGEGTSLTIPLFLFIHHFQIDHNAPCRPTPPPPPRLLHIHCFQFLLGITVVPREIEDNGFASFGRVNTRCIKAYVKMVSLFLPVFPFFSHFLLALWSNATILSRKCYRDFGETNNNLSCIIKHWGVFY